MDGMLTGWVDAATALDDVRTSFDAGSDESFCDQLALGADFPGNPQAGLGSAKTTELADSLGKLAKRIAGMLPAADRSRCRRWDAVWPIADRVLDECAFVDLARLLRAAVLCPASAAGRAERIEAAAHLRAEGSALQGGLRLTLTKAAGIALRDGDPAPLASVIAAADRIGFALPISPSHANSG